MCIHCLYFMSSCIHMSTPFMLCVFIYSCVYFVFQVHTPCVALIVWLPFWGTKHQRHCASDFSWEAPTYRQLHPPFEPLFRAYRTRTLTSWYYFSSRKIVCMVIAGGKPNLLLENFALPRVRWHTSYADFEPSTGCPWEPWGYPNFPATSPCLLALDCLMRNLQMTKVYNHEVPWRVIYLSTCDS